MKVKFLPQDISVPADPNKSVMELAREQRLKINSSCNGMCSCAECRVSVVQGEAYVLPPSQKEMELIGGAYFINSKRLSCQLFCFGDVTVDLSEQADRKKNLGKKSFLRQTPADSESHPSSSEQRAEKSHALADILVEQDQDMGKITLQEDTPLRQADPRRAKNVQNLRGTLGRPQRPIQQKQSQGRPQRPIQQRQGQRPSSGKKFNLHQRKRSTGTSSASNSGFKGPGFKGQRGSSGQDRRRGGGAQKPVPRSR